MRIYCEDVLWCSNHFVSSENELIKGGRAKYVINSSRNSNLENPRMAE